MSRFGLFRRRGSTGGPHERGPLLTDKLGLLREADLFRDLSEDEMRRLAEMTRISQCRRGEIIHEPGDSQEVMYILKNGRVQLYRLAADGKKLIVGTIEPGTAFGNMALTGQRMPDSYAEATADSTVCVMRPEDLEMVIREHPTVGIRLVRLLASRVRELEDRLEESSLRDVPSRIAAALVRASEQHGSTLEMTHQELADLVGTHRETVTRTLGDFRERGWIGLQRSHVEVLDRGALQRVASGQDRY